MGPAWKWGPPPRLFSLVVVRGAAAPTSNSSTVVPAARASAVSPACALAWSGPDAAAVNGGPPRCYGHRGPCQLERNLELRLLPNRSATSPVSGRANATGWRLVYAPPGLAAPSGLGCKRTWRRCGESFGRSQPIAAGQRGGDGLGSIATVFCQNGRGPQRHRAGPSAGTRPRGKPLERVCSASTTTLGFSIAPSVLPTRMGRPIWNLVFEARPGTLVRSVRGTRAPPGDDVLTDRQASASAR